MGSRVQRVLAAYYKMLKVLPSACSVDDVYFGDEAAVCTASLVSEQSTCAIT